MAPRRETDGDGGRAGNGNAVLSRLVEFRRNFLHLRPRDAAILNIEPDHFDCYDSQEALESAFARFAALLPADGRLIVPWDDAAVQRVAASAGCRIETFGERGFEVGGRARPPSSPTDRTSRPFAGSPAGSASTPTGWLRTCRADMADMASIWFTTAES